jgi:GNAT superfamily N-acetyltransferase
MFNAAFFSSPVAPAGGELERRIDTAVRHFASRDCRWAFWASESKLEARAPHQVRIAFRGRGLHPSFRHPGMACDELAPPRPGRLLPDLEFRPVAGRPSRLAFSHINAVAFRLPFHWCAELYDVDALWDGNFIGTLGCVDGEPVCTAATLVASGAVGLYSVATLPGHERRGYGEAITRYAVERARASSGLTRLILQATDAGLPLYRRLGYRTVTHFGIYST